MTPKHTQGHRQSRDPFPAAQLAVLGICRLSEPIAFTSIFAYSWVMVKEFEHGDARNASLYAGLLVSAFAVAEVATSMLWGRISDRIGRKPVVLFGLAGAMLSNVLFGFATNFWTALLARVLGGLLNGNIGVMQTVVAELAKTPEHEPKAYAVLPFMWSLGTIVGPAVGGTFAKPATHYPKVFSPNGLFGKFPYLLPNLVCAVFILAAILQGALFLKESHPDLQPVEADEDECAVADESRLLLATPGTILEPVETGFEIRRGSYGTVNSVTTYDDGSANTRTNPAASQNSDPPPKAFNKRIIMLIVALIIYSYHQMAFAHLLPIFLQDTPHPSDGIKRLLSRSSGGLGLTVQEVGFIMSANGVIALFIQGCIFPIFAKTLGAWRVFLLATVLHPVAYLLMPFLTLLTPQLLSPGIYIVMALRSLFSTLYYPVSLILIKQATPSSSVLGRVNGLAMAGGSAARTFSPPVAGLVYGVGGSSVAWGSCVAVTCLGIFQLLCIPAEKGEQKKAESSRC